MINWFNSLLPEGVSLQSLKYVDDGDDTVTIKYRDKDTGEILCEGSGETAEEILESMIADYAARQSKEEG